MNLHDSVTASIQNIVNHKMRSFLTLLGIIIGVFAVVTMFSSVYGLKGFIKTQMEQMGWNNSIIIYPSEGEENNATFSRWFLWKQKRENKPLTLNDYKILKRDVDSQYIYGMVESWQKYFFSGQEKYVQLRSTNNDLFKAQTYEMGTGRYFNAYENSNASKVCILGHFFKEEYFAQEDPIGKFVRIGKHSFKIIGVLSEDVLSRTGMDFNSWERKRDLGAVYIPLSTGSKYLRSHNALDYIYLQAWDDKSFNNMKIHARQKMLAIHSMTHDFSFNDVGALMLKITEELKDMMEKWNITLFAIASISLIVGGIGLFSTLLISINERMKEIGIRKSIGATEGSIFLHFLLEAVILAFIAAIFGIFGSVAVAKILGSLIKIDFPIPLQGIVLGLGFSLIIGILSGLYPAIKASRIDPIKAIYYFE